MSATTAPWPFHCASCAERGTGSALSFHDWDGMMRHMETEHQGDQHPNRCSSCTYVFGKMDDLQRHLCLGSVSSADRLEPPASRMLSRKIEEQHTLFPTLKRATEPVAPTAKRARSRMKISDLVNSNPVPKRGKFASYQGNPRFACKVCGISYQHNSNLQRHILMTHQACDLCSNEKPKESRLFSARTYSPSSSTQASLFCQKL